MEIVLVGGYPPPLGGNTVHIQRLSAALLDRGEKVTVVDFLGGEKTPDDARLELVCLSGLPWTKLHQIRGVARRSHNESIVHFHLSAMGRFRNVGPVLQWCFRGQPMVATIHSGSFVKEMEQSRGRDRLRRTLRRFDHLITVNQAQKDYLVSLGCDSQWITVVPAFIPQAVDVTRLPTAALESPQEKTIVLTSGYLTRLYNYDVLIDAMDRLDSGEFHFAFAFYNQFDPDYETHILARLSGRNNVTTFRNQPADAFLALMDHCDIYVRPTLTDGDAVAIREALHLRKPVIATDCVWRPEACDLFELHDSERLAELLRHCERMANRKEDTNSTASTLDAIMDIYRSVLKNR